MTSRTPKAADRAKGWPKLVRDCSGLKVRLLREARNGWAVIPAGTVGELEKHNNGWHLLRFRTEPCECCGVALRISRMSWLDFTPLTPPAAPA